MTEKISLDLTDATRDPWLDAEPVGDGRLLRVSWVVHSDAFRDGGRRGSHRGPCGRNAAHLILWHVCTGVVDMAAYIEAERDEFYPRWVPSMDPSLLVEQGPVGLTVCAADGGPVRWKKCCGLAGRVQDGRWIPA